MKTAVEWLIQELKENSLLTFDELKELFEQAKEMEKQRIIDFGYDIADKLACGVYSDKKAIEELHDEFFKSE
jgi:hypothetical protein